MVHSPTVVLRMARLRYVGLLYRSGEDTLWSLVLQDSEWLELIWSDLDWMHRQLWNTSTLPPPREDFEPWERIIQCYPSYWKRLIRRSGEHDIHQHAIVHDVCASHRNIVKQLEMQGRVEKPIKPQTAEDPTVFGCMTCGTSCKTKAGEGAHMFRCHGNYNYVRSLYDSSTCGYCLKHYKTPVRLGAHLKHSTVCRRGLLNRGVVGPPIPGAGSCGERTLEAQRDYPLPHQQCAGPLQQAAHGDDFPSYSVALSLDIVDHIFDSEDVPSTELMRQLQGVIRRSAVSWTTCRLTLRQIQGELVPHDFETLPISYDVYRETINALQDPTSWDFLCGTGLTTHDEVSECIGDYDEIFAADCPWRRTTQVPRVFGRHRYFLHCFSGRRRHGDLEHYMRCVEPPEGITLHVISLDIVIDNELGDLLRKESRSYWLHAIAQQWVIGLLCGPPCETWSRARGKLIKGRKGPRVVRSREAPWGKSSLGIREAKQVLFGNTLLLFCLEAFVGLLLNGGCSLIEHPSCPEDSTLVSIWRLPIIYFLLGLPEVQLLEVMQGFHGAASAKPTALLALRLPELGVHLAGNRIRKILPTAQSIGLSSDGSFKTSSLKEYPPALCRALGGCLANTISGFEVGGEEPPDDFRSRCGKLESAEFGMYMGRDFHG